MTGWNPAQPPRQHGRTVVVTGGNAGLGYFTAEQAASAGARVILASRDLAKADAAIASIRSRVPGAELDFVELDLASLDSVRRAADELSGLESIEGLVLNAGMTTGPAERRETADGQELILGTNYVGHFALTALLWPTLQRAAHSRVVGLGSLATRIVPLDPYDLQSERRYSFFRAYAFSKHAIHGFTLELDRRARASGSSTFGMLAHPGLSLDGLSSPRPGITEPSAVTALLAGIAQGKNRGAAPVVRALLDPNAAGGDFFGPRYGVAGVPRRATPTASSASPEFGRRLWALSEHWTGMSFPV